MSNSVFKEHPSAEGDNGESKTDSNLLVFINKNGSVSVDHAALQDLLVTDAVESKTSVTVLRVESPTPSFELEIEEEERAKKELDTDHSKDIDSENDNENDDDNEKENDENDENDGSSLKKIDDIKHVSVTIENFFLPEEAKKLASDILSLAGKTNPLQISVDFEHQLNVIANDHCYTPFKSPSQRKSELSTISQINSPNQRRESPAGRSTKSKVLKNTNTVGSNNQSTISTERGIDKAATKKTTTAAATSASIAAASASLTATDDASTNEDDDKLSGEEDDENSGSDSSYFSPTESDNDRDSDLDFNVNDRPSRVRKLPNRAKKQKQQQKLLSTKSKKRQNLSAESSSLQDTSTDDHISGTTTSTKKRPPKYIKRSPNTSTPLINKSTTKGTSKLNKLTKAESDSVKEDTVVAGKNTAACSVSLDAKEIDKQSAQQPIQAQPKKDKKPPAHVEALYSDMSSLFSTPDIIKKVNQPSGVENVTVNVSTPTNIKSYFMPSTTQQTKILSTTAITTTAASLTKQQRSLTSDLATEQDKQLELIDSIVQQELKEASPTKTTSMNDDIPKIVKMLELPSDHNNVIATFTTTTTTTPSTSQSIIPTSSTATGSSLSFSGAIDHELLDDSDLLEGLGNPDDTGLTEDLLQHVAKLAQDKNLQEVIDKQVLGVEPNSTTSLIQSPPLIIHTQQQQQQQQPAELLSNVTNKTMETKSLVTANTSKEPIKIIRSNGRVITLPPIEAPTTRGAKRRAQNQPTPDQQQSKNNKSLTDQVKTPIASNSMNMGVTSSTTKVALITSTPKTSKVKEKRASVASKKVIEVTPVKNEDDDADNDGDDIDEDEDSDGTYNSEDDPNRLWCICRQPHNNRFMICCDKCEEWFHGKCVNVTKAMGMEMERQGIEWVCPNCLKKLQPQTSTDDQRSLTQPTRKQPPTNQKQKQQTVQSTTSSAKKTKHNETVRKTPAKTTKTDSPIVSVKSPVPIAVTPESTPSTITTPSILSCIVCKKPARLGSIFCSDECISKQANVTGFGTVSSQNQKNLSTPTNDSTKDNKKPTANSSQVIKQLKNSSSAAISNETPKYLTNKNQRVIVIEKKTNRIVAGNNAPTIDNLKQWLQAHPTFEPITDNSERAVAIKAKQQQIRLAKELAPEKTLFSVDGQKVQTTIKIDPTKKFILINPTKQQQQQQNIVISGSGGAPTSQSTSKKTIAKITKIPAQVALKPGSPIKSPPSNQSPTKLPQSVSVTKTTPIARQTSSSQQQTQPSQQTNKRKQVMRKNSSPANESSGTHYSKSSKTEPFRINVQRMFKEQISLRCAEECTTSNCPKLTEDEITKFARDTESEIYHLFNKDTGPKYLSKYRSLLFNIKDRKNQTLFEKICNKAIEPKQLVRMLPEELASQQLALWRENENKHQLEMIKKSELDLLACAKNYVLKTHKGEEVIESKGSDRVTLDPSISVEDVVSVLNNSTVSSTSESLNESIQLPLPLSKDTRIDSRFDKYLSVDSSSATITTIAAAASKLNSTSSSTITAAIAASSSSSVSKKKETRRSRSRSRDRQKSSSSSSKHKRKRSRERRSRSRERDKSRSDERGRDRDRDQKSKKDDRKDRDRIKSSTSTTVVKHTNKDNTSSSVTKLTDTKEPPTKQLKKDDNSHLIDKIIEAQSTIDRILGTTTTVSTLPPPQPTAATTIKTVEKLTEDTKTGFKDTLTTNSKSISKEAPTNILIPVKKTTGSESDQEPSSTVTIPTPPENSLIDDDQIKSDNNDDDDDNDADDSYENTLIWTGTIIMPDVATFQMTIRTFDGDCMSIQKELRSELEVVGRIVPDNVWEYISKIKKTTKEVLVVRLGADSLDDRQAYYELYRCLSTRKRLGVVKSGSPLIKDFYIFPLAKHKSMPSVLLPMKSSTAIFENDRPDLLFGIIVKFSSTPTQSTTIKRASVTTTTTTSASTNQSNTIKVRVAVDLPKIKSKAIKLDDDQRYTPPSSPRTFVTKSTTQSVPLPVIRKEKDDLENIESDSKSDKEKDDGDEPYSPGGSDDDDVHFIIPPTVSSVPPIPVTPTKIKPIPATVPMSPSQMDADEITRKMDEINRQIVKSKIEIAGMLLPGGSTAAASILADEPYSPTSAPISKSMPTLANISIPSNLQEILNSIKNVTTTDSSLIGKLSASTSLAYSKGIADNNDDDDDEEYTPAPISAPSYASTIDYIPSKTISNEKNNENEPSKLARLTDEELMSMVPDDMEIGLPPVTKKAKYSIDEPPPPGLEDEYVP